MAQGEMQLFQVRVDTVEGSADEGSDYRGIHDDYTIYPGQTELPIEMEISQFLEELQQMIQIIRYSNS